MRVVTNRVPSTTSADALRLAYMAKRNTERVGARIKARREELKRGDEKWTQSYVAHQLSERTGRKTTGQDVSRYETGRHRPEDDTLEALADVLMVNCGEFFSDPPDKSKTPDLLGDKGSSNLEAIEAALTKAAAERAEMRTQLDEIGSLLKQIANEG